MYIAMLHVFKIPNRKVILGDHGKWQNEHDYLQMGVSEPNASSFRCLLTQQQWGIEGLMGCAHIPQRQHVGCPWW